MPTHQLAAVKEAIRALELAQKVRLGEAGIESDSSRRRLGKIEKRISPRPGDIHAPCRNAHSLLATTTNLYTLEAKAFKAVFHSKGATKWMAILFSISTKRMVVNFSGSLGNYCTKSTGAEECLLAYR